MTKREVLVAICDTPGWQPPEDPQINAYVNELLKEGWVTLRLDGFEAAPHALDLYPAFGTQADLADPAVLHVAPEPEPEPEAGTVAAERVVWMVAAMLSELPVITATRIAMATPKTLPDDEMLWRLARRIARETR